MILAEPKTAIERLLTPLEDCLSCPLPLSSSWIARVLMAGERSAAPIGLLKVREDWDRVVPGGCPPGTPTDPDMQNYRIRFLWLRLCFATDGMHDAWPRQRITRNEPQKPRPRRSVLAAPSAEPLVPDPTDLLVEGG